MIRLTYISSYGEDTTLKDIEEIGKVSMKNNERDGLTGVLLCFRGVFYQIIEGEAEPLYRCFRRIKADSRHTDIFMLSIEKDIEERLYSEWKMKTILLSSHTYPLIRPIRNLLDSLTRTHRVLEKYVSSEILGGIQRGEDPTTWEFKRDEMVILFVDLVSFTTITEKINLEEMQILLDTFFELSTRAVVWAGGKISKFKGDGLMAYFPAAQATAALRASLTIIRELKKQRETTGSAFLKYAYCGIGLSAGSIVKGNIGSSIRQDYTVLGDVVNSASRLETLTRQTGHSILFDDRFMSYFEASPDLPVIHLGQHMLKGKSRELSVYTIDHPAVPFDRTPDEIARAIRAIRM